MIERTSGSFYSFFFSVFWLSGSKSAGVIAQLSLSQPSLHPTPKINTHLLLPPSVIDPPPPLHSSPVYRLHAGPIVPHISLSVLSLPLPGELYSRDSKNSCSTKPGAAASPFPCVFKGTVVNQGPRGEDRGPLTARPLQEAPVSCDLSGWNEHFFFGGGGFGPAGFNAAGSWSEWKATRVECLLTGS